MYTAILTPWLQEDLCNSPRVYQNEILKLKPVYKVGLHEDRVDQIMQEMIDYENCHNQGIDLGEFDVGTTKSLESCRLVLADGDTLVWQPKSGGLVLADGTKEIISIPYHFNAPANTSNTSWRTNCPRFFVFQKPQTKYIIFKSAAMKACQACIEKAIRDIKKALSPCGEMTILMSSDIFYIRGGDGIDVFEALSGGGDAIDSR